MMTGHAEPTEKFLIDLDPGGLVWTGLDVDDDLALLIAIALNRSKAIHLNGLTIAGGNAPIKHTAPALELLLRIAGIATDEFPAGIARGHGWHSMHVPWPSMRRLNAISPDEPSSDAAAELIIREALASGPRGLTVVTLGPPTNLAAALHRAPEIAPMLHRIVMMGGQLDSGGKMCLNFMSDRAAVRAVISSPVPTMLVPIQTCAQASMTAAHIGRLSARCCAGERPAAVCALVPKMELQSRVMPWLVNRHVAKRRWVGAAKSVPVVYSPNLDRGFIPWDLVAMLAAVRPALFDGWQRHRVHIHRCAGWLRSARARGTACAWGTMCCLCSSWHAFMACKACNLACTSIQSRTLAPTRQTRPREAQVLSLAMGPWPLRRCRLQRQLPRPYGSSPTRNGRRNAMW